jgi:hypothetical protein
MVMPACLVEALPSMMAMRLGSKAKRIRISGPLDKDAGGGLVHADVTMPTCVLPAATSRPHSRGRQALPGRLRLRP